MAFTRGRCTNFDYCTVAESRRDIEVRVGEDFVCPECGKPLRAPQITGRTTSPLVPALLGLGVLALVGGAVFLGMRMGGGTPPPAQVRSVAVPATSAPVARGAQPAAASIESIAKPANAAAAPPPPTPAENILARVHGAPGVGKSIMAPLAAAYLSEIGDSGVTTSAAGDQITVSGLRGGLRESIVIAGDGVGAAFAALAGGQADLVIAPRRITAAEQSSAAALGDLSQPSAEHVLALGAQAVIVNSSNQVTSLSRAQIRDLFAGAFTDWSSLGGPPGPVDIYAIRPQGQRLANQTAGGEVAPEAAPGARWVADDAAVSSAVAADTRGVGLVDVASIGKARALPIAEIGAAPASPADHEAVARGDYPLSYKLYLYNSPKADSAFAQRLLAYALSAPGQAIVEQLGLISPTARAPAPAPAPVSNTDRLRAFVAGAKKLAIVFHFQPNSTALDNYGERDLDRVLNYLVSIHDGGDHLLLAGFADNQGDPQANVDVSRKRADSVAALFIRRGLKPGGVEGFGAELPVADNGTEAGRERNRRVEVYIKP
jgi:phosphate transport system substrate-binding protein